MDFFSSLAVGNRNVFLISFCMLLVGLSCPRFLFYFVCKKNAMSLWVQKTVRLEKIDSNTEIFQYGNIYNQLLTTNYLKTLILRLCKSECGFLMSTEAGVGSPQLQLPMVESQPTWVMLIKLRSFERATCPLITKQPRQPHC